MSAGRFGSLRLSWRDARVLVLLFVLSLPAVTPRLYASDEVQYFSYLRSLWFDRDVSFDNEYRHFYDAGVARTEGFRETFLERTTETGRRINFGTIGCALLWAPFYAVGDLTARALTALGYPVPIDGYSKPYVAAVAYGSATYGLLSLLVACAMVARLARGWSSLAAQADRAAVAVWLGTPLLFYMYVAPPMSHATSAFTVALFLLAWLVVRQHWSAKGLAVLGGLAALMAMVREQDAFFVVAPAVDFAGAWWQRPAERRRLAVAAAVGSTAAVVCFVPQALAYLALNGRIGPSRLVARKMTWTSPHALEVLAAPAHGFLVWTPLAALALGGLYILLRRSAPGWRLAVVGLIAAVALQVYVGGSVESWTVAGAFGQRRFVALSSILVCGLAAVVAAVAPRAGLRRLTWVGIALAVWWNVALMVQFGAGLMNRQRLEPGRIAYNSFVVVPRELPALAWRYVFDRASFYESARQLRAE